MEECVGERTGEDGRTPASALRGPPTPTRAPAARGARRCRRSRPSATGGRGCRALPAPAPPRWCRGKPRVGDVRRRHHAGDPLLQLQQPLHVAAGGAADQLQHALAAGAALPGGAEEALAGGGVDEGWPLRACRAAAGRCGAHLAGVHRRSGAGDGAAAVECPGGGAGWRVNRAAAGAAGDARIRERSEAHGCAPSARRSQHNRRTWCARRVEICHSSRRSVSQLQVWPWTWSPGVRNRRREGRYRAERPLRAAAPQQPNDCGLRNASGATAVTGTPAGAASACPRRASVGGQAALQLSGADDRACGGACTP